MGRTAQRKLKEILSSGQFRTENGLSELNIDYKEYWMIHDL